MSFSKETYFKARTGWTAQLLLALLLLVISGCLSSTVQAATILKIMPIGDSITQANSGHNSYRYLLYTKLKAAGYAVDFVGSMTKPYTGDYAVSYTKWDSNHEGHWGWRADAVLAKMSTWAAVKPNVALIHLGSNDMNQAQTVSSTVAEIGGIIDRLRAANPNVTILMAKIIPWNNSTVNARIISLNAAIPGLATSKSTTASKVIVVDQYSGFSASSNTYDGVHPNPTGEEKLATKWFTALKTVLPAPGTFILGINLNGTAGTIEGNAWKSYATAKKSGLTFSPTPLRASTALTPSPAVDTATKAMLNTGIWGTSTWTLNQTVTNGNYNVYLWVMENYATNTRKFDVKIEGANAATRVGLLAKGAWKKYGPYPATVADGVLSVRLVKVTGNPQLMGIAIYKR